MLFSATGNDQRAKPRHARPAWGKLVLASLIVAALAAVWHYTPLGDLVTRDRIAYWAALMRETSWAPVALMLAFTPAAFLMFPRPLLSLFSVIAFGPWLGIAYSVAGVLGATLATYYAGRLFRYDTVCRLAGAKAERVSRALRHHGLLAVVAINMIPVPPFGLQGIIAGAMRIKVWHYAVGCLLAMTPGMILAAIFGKELGAALEDPSALSYWILGVSLVVFAVLTFVLQRWTRRYLATSP